MNAMDRATAWRRQRDEWARERARLRALRQSVDYFVKALGIVATAMMLLAVLSLALGWPARAGQGTASATGWPFSLVCFRGDGHPLSDVCVDARFVTAEIVECPGGGPEPGNPSFPDRYTHAWVTLMEVLPDGTRVPIVATMTSARGLGSNIINYTVGDNLVFEDGTEACDCWQRAGGYCAGP